MEMHGRSSDKTKPMFKDNDFDVLDVEHITTTGPSHVSTADQVSTASQKNGDAGYRSRDNTRRTVPVETSDALVVQDNALIVQDGLGYD
ncbi:hypothetical protein Tco_0252094 [Tanacetum coccineum]